MRWSFSPRRGRAGPGREATRRLAVLAIFVLLGVALPLAGAWLAGQPLEPYLRFPAEPRPARPSFSWFAFAALAVAIALVVGPFVRRIVATPRAALVPVRRFPWWAWVGFGVGVIAWVLAWSRIPQFADYQRYTFTPLWLGYILVINGLVWRRTGHCLVRDRPLCFLLLFPASAAFWWYFEYLNRYAGNWYYVGIGLVSPAEYLVHASLSFSTVLPAVASTRDWLASFPRLATGLGDFWRAPFAASREAAWLLLALGGLGLVVLGIWPEQAYSLVWLAPLALLLALLALAGLPTPLAPVARGDWRALVLPAFAALFAGVFWEMWNWQSLARWQYAVPQVHGLKLFEMPLLGYAGYLPFGVVCVLVAELVCGRHDRRREANGGSKRPSRPSPAAGLRRAGG